MDFLLDFHVVHSYIKFRIHFRHCSIHILCIMALTIVQLSRSCSFVLLLLGYDDYVLCRENIIMVSFIHISLLRCCEERCTLHVRTEQSHRLNQRRFFSSPLKTSIQKFSNEIFTRNQFKHKMV